MAFGGGREACPCRPGLACLQKIAALYRGMHLFGPELTLFARQQRHSGGGVPLFRAGMLHFVRERFHFIYERSSFIRVILYFAHERSSFTRVMLHSGPERSFFTRVMLHSGRERSSFARVMLHSGRERSSFTRVMLHSGPERSSFARVMLHSEPERSSLTRVMLHFGRGMLSLAGEMLHSTPEPLSLGDEVLHPGAARGSVGNFVFEAVRGVHAAIAAWPCPWRPRRWAARCRAVWIVRAVRGGLCSGLGGAAGRVTGHPGPRRHSIELLDAPRRPVTRLAGTPPLRGCRHSGRCASAARPIAAVRRCRLRCPTARRRPASGG